MFFLHILMQCARALVNPYMGERVIKILRRLHFEPKPGGNCVAKQI